MSDDFRTLLRRFRDRRHWSQERLALEAEMDHSLVSRLEAGQRCPTRGSVAKLIAGLGLSTGDGDALWLAAGFIPPGVPPEAMGEAIAIVRTAMPEEVAAAVALVRTASAAEIAAARALVAAARRLHAGTLTRA